MKVLVEDTKEEKIFTPYKVTFFIQTPEESSKFHDRVAIKITEGPHDFIGHIFCRVHEGASGTREYDI